MNDTVMLSLHTNLIEVLGEENCQECKDKKSEVMLHGKKLCFDCTYRELRIALDQSAEQLPLPIYNLQS